MRRLVFLFFDLLVVAVSTFLALLLRDNLELEPGRIAGLIPYLVCALISAAVIFPALGTNRGFWRYTTFSDFVRIVAASLLVVLAATSGAFALTRLDGLARAVPILHFLLLVALMSALRSAMRLRHGRRSRAPAAPALAMEPHAEQVLVVGLNAVAELFVRSAQHFARHTIHVVGMLGRHDRHRGRSLHGIAVLGLPEELLSVLQRLEVHGVAVGRIVVAVSPNELSQAARDALRSVEDGSGIVVDYFGERLGFVESQEGVVSLPDSNPPSSDTDEAKPLPSLRQLVDRNVLERPYWRAKRALDFVLALVGIVVSAPLMLIVAALVAVDCGLPVLFWQERPGLFGRRLRLYKFRTMRSAHDEEGNRIPDARRSSVVGRFLRRSRLDELPQLFNILVGEMSFIGPRPLLPVDQAPGHMGRLAIRPGLTGWAQVHGGRDVSASDKAAMDLWYVRHASFRNDLVIALKTVHMVLFGERADAGVIGQAWKDVATWAVAEPHASAVPATLSRRYTARGAA